MTPSVLAHLAMNAPLSEREPGMAANHTPLPWDYVPSTEHHGPYITSSVGGTIADLYTMSFPSEPSAANGGRSKPVPFYHEMADPNAALIVRAVNSIDAVEAERDQLREAMKGATVIANQSGSLLRERDAKIEALVKALEEIDTIAVCTGVVDPKQHENMLSNIARIARAALITAAKGPAS